MKSSDRILLAAFAALLATSGTAGAQAAPRDTLQVYGPGGPLPAMKEAAAEFSRRHGIVLEVVGGPTSQWLEKATRDADVIFSGSEHMMTDFIWQLAKSSAGRIDESTVQPLYLRPAAILVRSGNPKRISRFEDLLKPGIKVIVVQGAGQTGLWEDIAGRTGDIAVVRAFRKNIAVVAPNSGDAKQRWTSDKTIDAWLTYAIWQVANREIADMVALREPWKLFRDAGIALTNEGREKTHAREFVAFLLSSDGARIFRKWGWITP